MARAGRHRHVAPAAAVAARVHLGAGTRPEPQCDLLPRPRREVGCQVLPRQDLRDEMGGDLLRGLPLLQHEHLVLHAVGRRLVAVRDEEVRAAEDDRRLLAQRERIVAPDEARALAVGRMAAVAVLHDAARAHTSLRHAAAPFSRISVFGQLDNLAADLDARRPTEALVQAEDPRSTNVLGGHDPLRIGIRARRVGVPIHEDGNRMRRVLGLHARRREAGVDGVEGVERAREGGSRECARTRLARAERERALRARDLPVVVHPDFERARDGLFRLVLQRHGKRTRRAGLHLGHAERPRIRVRSRPLRLLRKRSDLDPDARPFLDGRQIRKGCDPDCRNTDHEQFSHVGIISKLRASGPKDPRRRESKRGRPQWAATRVT